jgi:hypothetical protein
MRTAKKLELRDSRFQCRETGRPLPRAQRAGTRIGVVNSAGQHVKKSPPLIETVKMCLRRKNRVQGKTHRGWEHVSEVTWRGSGHFCSDTETLCKYPPMDRLRTRTLSGSTVLLTCRIAWESGSVRGGYRRQNASWWRTSRGLRWPTSSLESKTTGRMCRHGFSGDPLERGKVAKLLGKLRDTTPPFPISGTAPSLHSMSGFALDCTTIVS